MKRIDLFMPVKGKNSILGHFTKELGNAIERQGVKVRFLEAKYDKPKEFLDQLFADPPDCTLSFNGLLPDSQGRFFCEMIKTPHVACVVDWAVNFLPLVRTPFNVIVADDRYDQEFFKGMNFSQSLFMPQAADAELTYDQKAPRIYDVVLFSSFNDPVAIAHGWNEHYSPIACQVIEQAADILLSDLDISYAQAIVKVIDEMMRGPVVIDPNELNIIALLTELETYLKAKNLLKVLESLGDLRIDIFGNAPSLTAWNKLTGGNENVRAHDSVPFDQAVEIMKQSKIVINTCPTKKFGGHERIFYALMCGALPLTPDNIYLREFFKDGESIATYQLGNWRSINETVKYYLADEKLRQKVVAQGREEVLRSQTWDVRAKKLLEEIEPMIAGMKIKK